MRRVINFICDWLPLIAVVGFALYVLLIFIGIVRAAPIIVVSP